MVNNFERNYLTDVMLKLSNARDVPTIIEIVRHAARLLTGADGATFILRDKDKCYYIDEDAIEPLWKGNRFPLEACVSGWAMLNKTTVVIKDIYDDPRVPVEAYRPTFVKSMAMVPIKASKPIGAIGNYWGHIYEATDEEIDILELLADCTAIALENVETLNHLEKQLGTQEVNSITDEYIDIVTYELHRSEPSEAQVMEDSLSNIIKEQIALVQMSEIEVKRSIYDVSLRQLTEMNKMLRNLLVQR
jgi:GAF domain-containing protein